MTVPKLETINESTFRDIEYAHAILIEGGFTKPADGIAVPIEVDADAGTKVDFSKIPLSAGFRMAGVSHHLQLFDTSVELRPLTLTFDHATIELRQGGPGSDARKQSTRMGLRLLGSPGSTVTTRLSVESDFA